MSPDKKTQAHSLVDGANLIFANADALYSEATLLANAEAWARALFLHQISLEECAKIEMLSGAVTSLLMGHRVDPAGLRRAFARHESKNKANAYFLEMTDAEREAEDQGDTIAAHNAFGELQKAFHRDSNTEKNAALYVDFTDRFSSPLQLITEETFIKVRLRNEEFLATSHQKLKLLSRWSSDLDAAEKEVAVMCDATGLLRLDRSNPPNMKEFREFLWGKISELARRRDSDESR